MGAGLLLTATAKYFPPRLFVGALLVFILVSLTLSFINIRKKAAAIGPTSGLQKVSGIIIYCSAIGVMIALLFIVFHMRQIGHPLLNFSLILYIAGAVVGIMAPVKSINGTITPGVKQAFTLRTILYLCAICTVTGLLLRINHYPEGKFLMYGGLSFLFISLIFLIIRRKHVNMKQF